MIYVLGILIAAILSLGGVASCEHKKVQTLTAQIEANKLEAKRILDAEKAQGKADAIASQKDYDDALKTLSIVNRQYAGRLRDPAGRNSCPPASTGTASVPTEAPTGADLSDSAGAFLRAEADRADLAATYAAKCRDYALKPSIRQSLRGTP